ncbi:DUF6368 family protein [Streptomyces sp. NPDC019645]|uniref:DUF6368 family protein n=1 Tax=Streptomyces sp. NPDC019645 TaxID=3154786 RepID=UPI0033C46522
MSGPAVGLWLFEPREFGDILTEVVPWLESFCEPVETKVGSGLEFWVRDGSAVGLSALDPHPRRWCVLPVGGRGDTGGG